MIPTMRIDSQANSDFGVILLCTSISSSSRSQRAPCSGSPRYCASRKKAFTTWICRSISGTGANSGGIIIT